MEKQLFAIIVNAAITFFLGWVVYETATYFEVPEWTTITLMILMFKDSFFVYKG